MASSRTDQKQNVTISLSRQVLNKARILAARRETPISGLLAQKIEALVGEVEAYERAEKQAMGFFKTVSTSVEYRRPGATNCMNDKTFVDTDVLISPHHVDANAKHEAAKSVLHELWNSRSGILSRQALQEFYGNVTRKIPRPIFQSICHAPW